MNINGIGANQSAQIQALQQNNASSETAKAEKPSFTSMVAGAGESGAASDVQDMRAQKVAALKEQVQSGNYNPDVNQVAQSMMQFVGGADQLFD